MYSKCYFINNITYDSSEPSSPVVRMWTDVDRYPLH